MTADFRTARLKGANFAEAVLCGARFSEADLADAMLSKADVRGADFRHARNLFLQQLSDTIGDETTVLPAGMTWPENWEQQRQISEDTKRERHVPLTWRLTRRGLAACASLIVVLGLISAVVVNPAPPSRAAADGQSAPQPAATATFTEANPVVAPPPSALPTGALRAAIKLRTAESPGISLPMAPTSARRIDVGSDTMFPVHASVCLSRGKTRAIRYLLTRRCGFSKMQI